MKISIADLVVEENECKKYIVEIDKSYSGLILHKEFFNTCRLIVENVSSDMITAK